MAAAPRPESGETVAVGEAGLNFLNSFPLSREQPLCNSSQILSQESWPSIARFSSFFFEKPGNDI